MPNAFRDTPALNLNRALKLTRIALAATVTAATALSLAAPAAADWSQFRRTPAQLGVAAESLPENLKPIWIHRLPDGAETTPAIVDGTVYIGGLSGRFVALDLKTGDEKWTAEVGEEIKSSALVRDGVVYFGDELGNLHALDAATGAKKWLFEAESSITSSPNWASYDGGDCLVVGSYDNSIYCVDPQAGTLKFKVETEGHVHGTPAVLDGLIYSSGCDGMLRG
ncbi:MAG: PQQ-binding-like beta-propeller repeat protein, partial [Acidobacteriota bacterium]